MPKSVTFSNYFTGNKFIKNNFIQMNPVKLGSGDNYSAQTVSPRYADSNVQKLTSNLTELKVMELSGKDLNAENITIQSIEDHESKLKDRIAQCRDTISSLKLELNEEKAKIEKEAKSQPLPYTLQAGESMQNYSHNFINTSTYDFLEDLTSSTNMYRSCVDSKLNCDENLMEYEKQLETYQNTLNMAQIEKKNAIRKQMLTKAFKLKLLELENQCNIELLRVKQNLQCLEPLQMIANKWKIEAEEASNDLDKYELMPRYPELSTSSGVEVAAVQDDAVETVSTDS